MITIKEEFLGSIKTKRAIKLGGSDSVVLWLALKGYVSAGNTGGFIPTEAIPDLDGVPKNWRKAMRSLVECGKLKPDGTRGPGLVHEVEHGYQLHDYEDHGTPVEVEEERRRKAREQKRRRREQIKREAEERARLEADMSGGQHKDMSAGQYPDTGNGLSGGRPPCASGRVPVRERDPQPSPAQPGEEDPPAPFPEPERTDPFAASLTGRQPHDRPDVNRLHDEYKRVFGLPHRRWYSRTYSDARVLADAIDAHGIEDCLLVVNEAPNDGMVSGRDDERKAKHESIGYIFDNASAFDRILRAAKKRAESGARKSISDQVADLKKLKVAQ